MIGIGGFAGCTGDSPQTDNESPTDTPTPSDGSGDTTSNPPTQTFTETETTESEETSTARDLPNDLAELEDAMTGWFYKKGGQWGEFDTSRNESRVHFEPKGQTGQGGTKYTMFSDLWLRDEDLAAIKEEGRREEFIRDEIQTAAEFFVYSNSQHPHLQPFRPENRDPSQYRVSNDVYRFQRGDDINPPYAKLVVPPGTLEELEQKDADDPFLDYMLDPDNGLQIVLED